MVNMHDLSWEFSNLYVPVDNHSLRERYEASGKGGTCGPSAIAVMEKTSVQVVLDRWCGKGPECFRGFSPISEMKQTLEAFGYRYVYVKAHKAKVFPTPRTKVAILRIQWLKEDGSEYYWAAAGAHSHYVLMQKVGGAWWIFCNGDGWFKKDSVHAAKYLLRRGYVSSYLELSKPDQENKTLYQIDEEEEEV